MILMAFFTEEGTPKTGLSPTIDVWEDDGTHSVNAQAMTEIAGGFYKYDFAGYDESLNYCIRADGGEELAVNDRYVFNTNEVGQVTEDLTDIDTLIDGIKERTDNLPDDPADDSDIDGQLSTIDGKLDIVQTDLDNPNQYKANVSNLDVAVSTRAPEAGGNIAAIKVKTDTIAWADITFLKDIEGGEMEDNK